MLSILHLTTGAFIASKISNPFFALPLIVATHYLADWIPHWDVGTGLSTGKRSRLQAFFWGVVDLLIGYGLVVLLHRFVFGSEQSLWWLLLGATAGILPDLLEAPKNFLKIELPGKLFQAMNSFHHRFHHSIYSIWLGLTPQVFVFLLIILFSRPQ
jgi:hypothetical protein